MGTAFFRRRAGWGIFFLVLLTALPGCSRMVSEFASDPTGRQRGVTYFLGGAGAVGSAVGTLSVPRGLRAAGYRGAIEIFPWQSDIGWELRDQIDVERNREQARKLARQINTYLKRYPDRPVNIIALSAGTGIATWALEALPLERSVNTVVFLGSSLSRHYDLTPALRRVGNRLYNFYSSQDDILKYALPITGSVDRGTRGSNIAGLIGFELPPQGTAAYRLHRARLRNLPYLQRYALAGWDGGHIDSTDAEFIQKIVAPLLMRPAESRVAEEFPPPPTSLPAAPEPAAAATSVE